MWDIPQILELCYNVGYIVKGGSDVDGFAYFMRRPARAEELKVPHPLEAARQYEIISVISLRRIDYENFITDLLADRAFLEPYAPLCSKDGVWKCVLVSQRGKKGGILVMPENGCYVGWAALV